MTRVNGASGVNEEIEVKKVIEGRMQRVEKAVTSAPWNCSSRGDGHHWATAILMKVLIGSRRRLT